MLTCMFARFSCLNMRAINEARGHVGALVGAAASDIVFTSGGTEVCYPRELRHCLWQHFGELILLGCLFFFHNMDFLCKANNTVIDTAVNCALQQNQGHRPHVVSSVLEHDSVARRLDRLYTQGRIDLDLAPVDVDTCQVLPEAVASLIRPSTCLVTIMLANNETGVIQPVAAIVKAVRAVAEKAGVPAPLFHTDAAQVTVYMEKNI